MKNVIRKINFINNAFLIGVDDFPKNKKELPSTATR